MDSTKGAVLETSSSAAMPLLWAHRGASREAPENTLAAFALAQRLGADGIELDAQLCGSGEVVVHHDDSLGRTTGFAALVAETPWSVIRTLDAGARFDARFIGERVPLLEDVLGSTSVLVNVELKCERSDDRGLTAAVLRAVRRTAAEGRVLVSSFNLLCLLRAALHPEDELATAEAIVRWRRRGYGVAPWTVDDPMRAAALWKAGVTGIITNVPGRMREALRGQDGGPTADSPVRPHRE
jgi:glycerophosphoryl diester phosphodiesterase